MAGLVNTQVNAARANRSGDGSVLNVGSESSMKIVKHRQRAADGAGADHGSLRTGAKNRQARWEIRSAHTAGVAGVVGTDFFFSCRIRWSMRGHECIVFEVW